MKIKTLENANVADKRIMLRVDFNVPLTKNGEVADETRIKEALPTINYLLAHRTKKIFLISHLGRPNGKFDPALTLKPVSLKLEKYLRKPIPLFDLFFLKQKKGALPKDSQVILIENIRFYKGEEENNKEFAKKLASLADIFVNDAFGTAHRTHASTVGIADFLPSFAGLLMEKEVKLISRALERPGRPFVVIIGGAKTPEKINVIAKFLRKANTLLLGGAIANTFLSTWGLPTGCSQVDYELQETAKSLFWQASRSHSALILPVDAVVSDAEKKLAPRVVSYNRVKKGMAIFDIGPRTKKLFARYIKEAKTIIWNGPMGVYEDKRFAQGTDFILRAIALSKGTSIVGGGDTLSSLSKIPLAKRITHLSTGGGAMLEFLEKGTLPGIEVLS